MSDAVGPGDLVLCVNAAPNHVTGRPAQHWQAAEPLGDFTLVGCTVSPGFDFAGFEMAPKDLKPGK